MMKYIKIAFLNRQIIFKAINIYILIIVYQNLDYRLVFITEIFN